MEILQGRWHLHRISMGKRRKNRSVSLEMIFPATLMDTPFQSCLLKDSITERDLND